MMRAPWILAGTLVAMAMLLAPPVARAASLTDVAPPANRTETIANDTYSAFSVAIGSTWALVMGVEVTSGTMIDVYVTDQAGYNQYIDPTAPQFAYLPTWTQERVTSYNKTIGRSGPTYIILDNARVTTSGASPTGPVTVRLVFVQSSGAFLTGVIALVVIAALVAVVLYVRMRRKRRRAAAQMPPEMPPPMPPPGTPP